VTAVIDLRAEAADTVDTEGIRHVRVPIRDGQAPGDRDLATVRTIVASASGPVFVHCSAGVGRTGSIVATLRCDAGTSPRTALAEALSFGPLSLEQQAFILRGCRSDRSVAGLAIVALSRVADAPRRAWSRLWSRLQR
jgi:protein-tyrosine phosphatase